MGKKDKLTLTFKNLKIPAVFIIIFYSIAFWRYSATGEVFYIYNFIYIGSSIALGIFLLTRGEEENEWQKRIYADRITGSHSHHRNLSRDAATSPQSGKGEGKAGCVYQ